MVNGIEDFLCRLILIFARDFNLLIGLLDLFLVGSGQCHCIVKKFLCSMFFIVYFKSVSSNKTAG